MPPLVKRSAVDVEQRLVRQLKGKPYLEGNTPGKRDCELFEEMLGGKGNTYLMRWARHMASFPASARAQWPPAAPRAAEEPTVASVPAAAGPGGRAAQLRAEIEALQDSLASMQRQLYGEEDDAPPAGKGLIDLRPEQGCRDFPPERMRVRRWLFGKFREVAQSFGFEEYDAPVLEPENLYVVKAQGQGGEKTGEDILNDMYNFVTKGGHRVALRPEMTPTLVRLVMQKGQSVMVPLKWFSIPQCWRHEAIVRGRRREHYQWNMDVIGVKAVTAEAELIAAVVALLQSVGLTSRDVGIKINSRKLLQTVLTRAGVPDELFAPVCVIVDKFDKLERSEVEAMLSEKGLGADATQAVLATLSLNSLDAMRAQVGADAEVITELEELLGLLEAYGVRDWVVFDASVVRGLAYYTGVVFECFDREGRLRAICGGGRYDNLFKKFGHTAVHPACGFGFGDCVIIELLKDKGLMPNLDSDVQDLVIPFGEPMRSAAVEVVSRLRAAGRQCDIVIERKLGLKKALSYADRVGADRAVLLLPDEWSRGKVRVQKILREGDRRPEHDSGEKREGEELTVEQLVRESAQ
eukprot:TRINITY_DN1894_c0_g1_i2.p1 TRINITY_DN1894_c0_g1~~TRINITY_DN1894_c0_g1_i2.p1  ORF type:complete len:601 (+),score=202.65 TRINITY_DN1894_c0_g1_i2:69-1805(+)